MRRLEPPPGPSDPIDARTWSEALGDPRRLGDWPAWFRRELAEAPWKSVLAVWWPRLLPGIAAGATHGVIRVGHAVRVLREHGPSPIALEELAQAFAYWAAHWQPVHDPRQPIGQSGALEAMYAVSQIGDRNQGITHRLAQLEGTEAWQADQRRARGPRTHEEAEPFLRELVAAAVEYNRTHGNGNPTMLAHAATAPNAVLRALPSLPEDMRVPSAQAAWTAAAALVSIYRPDQGLPEDRQRAFAAETDDIAEAQEMALATGDEHAIKFADTADDVLAWTGDATAVAAVTTTSRQLATGR